MVAVFCLAGGFGAYKYKNRFKGTCNAMCSEFFVTSLIKFINQFAQVHKHDLPAFARLVSEIVQIRKHREAQTYVSESHNCLGVHSSVRVCLCVCLAVYTVTAAQ